MSVAPTPPAIDKSRCAQEPIHIPGSIQPHGMLVVLDGRSLLVTQVSANVETHLGIAPGSLCGVPLAQIFGPAQAARLEAAVRRAPGATGNPLRFVLDAGGVAVDFECVVHRSGEAIIVELEPYQTPPDPAGLDLFAAVRTKIARMEAAPDIAALVQGVARDVRAINGFDRVMVYRFEADWSGDVLAESTSAAAPVAYLGLHFPSDDIPEQARRLYVRSPLRLIADVNYVPAMLVPRLDPHTGSPVDLSRAVLRSVSPIHLEYLQNIGVRAALSVSVVIGGRLWGLIACHHLTPRRLDFVTRAACEFFGQMLAWQLGSRLVSNGLQDKLRSNALIGSYERSLGDKSDLSDGLIADAQDVLDLFGAQGFVVLLDGGFRRFGQTPSDDAVVMQIAAALRRDAQDGVAANHELGTLAASAEQAFGVAGGALLITLSEPGDEYLLCFRAEVIEAVNWAGDVRTTVTDSAGAIRPRKSFALWQETVRGRSARWSPHDISGAHTLRERIFARSRAIERRRAEDRARYLARHDALTQLPNRTSFHETLNRAILDAQRDGDMLAVFFIDLDHFKLFNDEFGHTTGDLILQAAGGRMKTAVRHHDIVARLGGDEFAIVATNLLKEHDADAVARKVLAAIAQPFCVAEEKAIRLTASLGIAVYPGDEPDADTLLRHADLAMYRAKELGRNSFARFDPGDSRPAYERLTLARRIELGLAQDEFLPYYQPVVALETGRIMSFEALARWKHPDLGLLPPSRFIAIAEESRLIVSLGEAILRASCQQTAHWRSASGFKQLRISVNVSARQFRESGFLRAVFDAVAQAGLGPEALQLELTESMLIENEEYAVRTLRALADAGVSMAIDDFGTGYSSLSYLKRLPVDAIKIDRSFVADLTPLPDDSAIVRAIIAMAHSLKLTVIAEGVETAEQLDLLRAEGCDAVQGYLVAKPLARADATAFIAGFDLAAILRGATPHSEAPV